MWDIVRKETNNVTNSTPKNVIHDEYNAELTPTQAANAFNEYYAEMPLSLTRNLPNNHTNTNYWINKINFNPTTIFLEPTI